MNVPEANTIFFFTVKEQTHNMFTILNPSHANSTDGFCTNLPRPSQSVSIALETDCEQKQESQR